MCVCVGLFLRAAFFFPFVRSNVGPPRKKMRVFFPLSRRRPPFLFLWMWTVYLATFALRISHAAPGDENRVRLYYISDLLNSSHDPVEAFAVRWALWTSVAGLFWILLRRTHECLAAFLAVSWLLAIVTGFDARVFGGAAPSDAWRYSHYAATALVMLASSVVVSVAYGQPRAGAAWLLITVLYGGGFLLSRFHDGVDIPSQVFMAVELVFYAYVSILVVARDPVVPLDMMQSAV